MALRVAIDRKAIHLDTKLNYKIISKRGHSRRPLHHFDPNDLTFCHQMFLCRTRCSPVIANPRAVRLKQVLEMNINLLKFWVDFPVWSN